MNVFVLILTYSLSNGDIQTNLSVHKSLAECEYVGAVIENDHAYMPRNDLLQSECKRYTFNLGQVMDMIR